MDSNLILILGVLLIVGFVVSRFLGNRNPAPPGTYDDPNTRSGGSFGGRSGQPGQRAYDDPDTESGGSFGGAGGQPKQRTFDDPNTQSGGSFGGGGPSANEREQRSSLGQSAPRSSGQSGREGGKRSSLGQSGQGQSGSRASRPASPPASRGGEKPRNDDPNTKSGGSFGGG
jgi:hypothetical protein